MLAERHPSELGMLARPFQIGRGQTQRRETAETVSPQVAEGVQQLGEALALRCVELSKSIERGERDGFPMGEKMLRTRHPIRTFPVNEMPDDVKRAPRVRTLCASHPGRREIAE